VDAEKNKWKHDPDENSDLPKKSILVKPNKKPPPMKKIFLDT